jgi:Fe-S-cluster formation regulator IscX/YfhJ
MARLIYRQSDDKINLINLNVANVDLSRIEYVDQRYAVRVYLASGNEDLLFFTSFEEANTFNNAISDLFGKGDEVTETMYANEPEVDPEIMNFIRAGKKIQAIKRYREIFQVSGLKDAKLVLDKMFEDYQNGRPVRYPK